MTTALYRGARRMSWQTILDVFLHLEDFSLVVQPLCITDIFQNIHFQNNYCQDILQLKKAMKNITNYQDIIYNAVLHM